VILYERWHDDYDNNISSHELEECKEVENYDRGMKSHLNYPSIFYNRASVYKQRLNKIYLAKIK
jgi:hypothetical protein